MIEDIITKTLEKLNIPTNIIEKYNEKHRVYHNFSHISNMIKYAIDLNILNDELLIAIIFHDIVYEIGSSTNEEDSVELLKLYYNNTKINNAILSTKNHIPNDRLSKLLCDLDLLPLYSDFRTFKEYDDKIFKEYQRYDYSLYLKSRVDFLRKMEIKKDYIDYVSSRDVKIGLFDGSFNRFHIGVYKSIEKLCKLHNLFQ